MRSYTRSSWQVPGGLLQLEIETDRPLPKWAWDRLGQIVDTIERFAKDVERSTPKPEAPDRNPEPISAAAARAHREGQLSTPPRQGTVRPASTYEVDE